MAQPVYLPDLGVGQAALRVSSWFSEPGDEVESGESLLEVLTSGITCDVAAPCSGRLMKIERAVEAEVHAGEIVAWIETGTDAWPGTD